MDLIIYFYLDKTDKFHTCQAVYKFDYSKELNVGAKINIDSILISNMDKMARFNFEENFKAGQFEIFKTSTFKNDMYDAKTYCVFPK